MSLSERNGPCVAHVFSIKKEAEIVVGCARKVEGAFDSELVDVIAAAL